MSWWAPAAGHTDRADITEPQVERRESSTVRIQETPAGLARALTHLGNSPSTTDPGRSAPVNRPYPPLLEFSEEPGPLLGPATAVQLRVPASFECLFAVAPLAYYAGASVEVGADRPRLTLPGEGVDRPLPDGRELAAKTGAALRRLFRLDCLAREGVVESGETVDRAELTAYGRRPMEGRLATVVDGLPDWYDGSLPDWHLTTYVAAEPENARAIPHLLGRMSLVYPPAARPLEGERLLQRALDQYRRTPAGAVATADRLDPQLQSGHVHAWLADGFPVSAAKTTMPAFENGLEQGSTPDGESIAVDVVLNDPEMDQERLVADVYRRHVRTTAVEVTVHESLTRQALAAVFESDTDFVHYVGHCGTSGLRCVDGDLPTAGLDVQARTFFLNACSSYREGLSLVDGGACAGAVTLSRVLNDQAVRVGAGFAQLLAAGFGIERALSLARGQVLMGQDYTVVGDGVYRLNDEEPGLLRVTGGPDQFEVVYEVVPDGSPGRFYRDPFDGTRRVEGGETRRIVSRARLAEFLGNNRMPVSFGGVLAPSHVVRSTLLSG